MKTGKTLLALCLAVALVSLSSLAQAAMRLVNADAGNYATWALTDSGNMQDNDPGNYGGCGDEGDGSGQGDCSGDGNGENTIILE